MADGFRVDGNRVILSGSLDADTVPGIYSQVIKAFPADTQIVHEVDVSSVDFYDSAGLAMVSGLSDKYRVVGAGPEMTKELDSFAGKKKSAVLQVPPRPGFFESVGRMTASGAAGIRGILNFTGESVFHCTDALLHFGSLSRREFMRVFEASAADAVPVVALISFLLGLILAFQSAIPLGMFGAEIYVANLIGISIIRELGTLVAAIVMAGRTSSSFAAEIGTMMVNEEISALKTMGINPVRYLVVPRILASAAALPMLSVFADLCGVAGGSFVVISLGYSFRSYCMHAVSFVGASDFLGSLFKAAVFGVIVAAVGCFRGFQTGFGADAVGRSVTSAVVSAIVAVAFADGIFAVVFFCLGI